VAVKANANTLETTAVQYAVRETRVPIPPARNLNVIVEVYNGMKAFAPTGDPDERFLKYPAGTRKDLARTRTFVCSSGLTPIQHNCFCWTEESF
jgi:hypothetical protein